MIMNLKLNLDVNVIEFFHNNLILNIKILRILKIIEILIKNILIYLKINIMIKKIKLEYSRKLFHDFYTVEINRRLFASFIINPNKYEYKNSLYKQI